MQRQGTPVDAVVAEPDAARFPIRPLLKEEETPATLPAVHAVGDSPGLSFHNRPLPWHVSVSRHPKKFTTATIAITVRTSSSTHRHPELPEFRLNLPVSGTCGMSGGGGGAAIARISRKYISDTSLHTGGRLSNLRGVLSYGRSVKMQAFTVFPCIGLEGEFAGEEACAAGDGRGKVAPYSPRRRRSSSSSSAIRASAARRAASSSLARA